MRFEVDAVLVVSLASRADRLDAFLARIPGDWPLPVPALFAAVDGRQEQRPSWWRGPPGAWGCYRSHAEIIACCLEAGVDRVLILEDDCTFVPDFAAKLAAIDVPADCQQLYLGGQHLSPPAAGPDGLVVARNVNRTHAYAVLGRQALELLADHLRPISRNWTSKHHVDHHYGLLHARGKIMAYAVCPWLCGQAAGQSDVGRGSTTERWWSRYTLLPAKANACSGR